MSTALPLQDAPPVERLPLYSLVAANIISQLGNSITNLAIVWYVIETTGSAANAGLAGFFTLLPMVLATFFGGALVDRLGRKLMSIVSDLASGATILAIPVLHQTVGLPLIGLFALIFCGALLDAPGETARRAMIPELARKAGMPLERATSLTQSATATVQLMGPIIAGVLVAAIGTSNVLYVDAATFAVSALIVARFLPAMPAVIERGGRYFEEVAEGLRFLRSHRLLITILTTALVLNFFASPFGGVMLPVFANEEGWGARSLGFLFSGFGAGTIVGSVTFGIIGPRLPRRLPMILALGFSGIVIVGFAAVQVVAIAVVLAFLVGISLGIVNPITSTIFLERVPDELRGRVLGAISAVSMCASPIGMLVAGPTVEVIGVRSGFVIVGAVFFLVAVWLLSRPVLREMERSVAEPELTS